MQILILSLEKKFSIDTIRLPFFHHHYLLNCRQLNGRGIRFRRDQSENGGRRRGIEGQNERIVIGRSYWKTKANVLEFVVPQRLSSSVQGIRSIFSSRYSPRRTNTYNVHFYFFYILRIRMAIVAHPSFLPIPPLESLSFPNPTFIYLPVIVLSSSSPSISSLLNAPVISHGSLSKKRKNIFILSNCFTIFQCTYHILGLNS